MKFKKLVKSDWQEDFQTEWFDTNYYINKIEKYLSSFSKKEQMPISWYVDGNKVIITIKQGKGE